MSKKVDRFLSNVRCALVWGNKETQEAIRDTIDGLYPYRPDYAKADLFARLVEEWDNYPAGIPRRIFVKRVLADWEYWYISTPSREPTIVVATDASLTDDTVTVVARKETDGSVTVLDIIKETKDGE